MTEKYSTGREDDDEGTRWEADRRYVLAQWSTQPFMGVRHRHETVGVRIVVEYHHGVGCDILLEARSRDTEKFPDEWAVVESIEVREYGARHTRRDEARWLDVD